MTVSVEQPLDFGVPDIEPRRKIVVGVDDTPGGLAALRYAVGMARKHNLPLVAVRAWALGLPRHGGLRAHHTRHGHVVLFFEGHQAREAAAALARRAFRAAGGIPADLAVRLETPEGNPGRVLTEIAGGEDLLVVGTPARWSVSEAIHGSVSAFCERHARCPVVIIKPSAPGSPGNFAPGTRVPARVAGHGRQ